MTTARHTWKDAYDSQMEMWRWMRTPGSAGSQWLVNAYEQECVALHPHTRGLLAELFGSEVDRLYYADPIFVSSELCEVIAAASSTFEPEPLYVTDLLTTCGFVYYEQPFIVPDRFDREVNIAGVSWTPLINAEVARDGTVAASEAFQKWASGEKTESGAAHGIAIALYERTSDMPAGTPRMLPMHITPWWFDMSFDGNEVDENGVQTGAAWWWKIVQTTFRLMQQRISVKHQERPDRAQRRSAARIDFHDREVVVVRLRREGSHDSNGDGEPANYSHRFIVSGHWRNQWYPASQIHRQIWISPYVKGPESLPLVIRPRRVFEVVR